MIDPERDQCRAAIRQALGALESMRKAMAEGDAATAALRAAHDFQLPADERETLPRVPAADHAADFDGADTDRPSCSELVGGCEEEGEVEPSAGDVVYVSMASLGP